MHVEYAYDGGDTGDRLPNCACHQCCNELKTHEFALYTCFHARQSDWENSRNAARNHLLRQQTHWLEAIKILKHEACPICQEMRELFERRLRSNC